MSWLTELSKVYDNTIEQNVDPIEKPMPLYHIANNASLTICLDENGNILTAELVEKNDKSTFMPCTESCSSRSSGADSYPLCDKLEYVCGEGEKFEKYSNLLKSWCESDFSNPKVKSVYKYISKKTLKDDLKKFKITESDVTDFIRWKVEISGEIETSLWKDEEVFGSWINFYNSNFFDDYCRNNFSKKDVEKRIRKNDLSYVTGELSKIAMYHPAKIRNAGDKAKIISSNDITNYTFRGRFQYDYEACQIDSDTTQKAHNALRWLIAKQGKNFENGLTVVTWKSTGGTVPNLTESSEELLGFSFDDEEDEVPEKIPYHTSREFAEKINNRLLGYFGDISGNENIMVMMLNETSVGQGRVSILVYREFQKSDMIEALNNWHNRLSWHITYWQSDNPKDKKCKTGHYVKSIGTPSPKTIAMCAYGEHVKANQVEKTVQRILPCILDGGKIPVDLEIQCVKSASNLLILDSESKREEVLGTACAVYKYNKIIDKKEEYKLALEEERKTRDYLFGRLLAVAQQEENAALRKMGEKRDTNAIRYMQQFSKHPSSTWKLIYQDKLLPYRRHLEPGLLNWFEKIVQDICALFDADDFISDKPLSGEYLLGYQCQLKAFRKDSDDESEDINNE